VRGHRVLYVGLQCNSTEQPQDIINHLVFAACQIRQHNIKQFAAQHIRAWTPCRAHKQPCWFKVVQQAAGLVTLCMRDLRQHERMLYVAVLTNNPKHDWIAYMQAADMSALWLKEIHLENTLPSHSQPLVHSVPWQLAHHALVYPQERHVEVSAPGN